MRVVSFGEILLRLAAPGYTRLFQRESLEATFCGSEANVAVSLAILGLDSVFVTRLPENIVGKAAINSMRCFGVDTGHVVMGNGRMGLYYLEKGASQRPSNVVYDRSCSAISLARRNDFNWDSIFSDVQWFHWTGINPALSDSMADICMDAVKAAKAKGISVSCDLNYRKKLWDSARAKTVMSQLMPYVDVCIANEEDADKVLGIRPDNNDVNSGKLNKKGYETVARKISAKYGCKYVAFTLRESYSASINGWSGMLFNAQDNTVHFSRKYDIHIVDRVGSGDSFGAGLIYSLMTGKQDHDAIEFAVAASCLKHTLEGDYNRVTVVEVENLLSSGGSGRVDR